MLDALSRTVMSSCSSTFVDRWLSLARVGFYVTTRRSMLMAAWPFAPRDFSAVVALTPEYRDGHKNCGPPQRGLLVEHCSFASTFG